MDTKKLVLSMLLENTGEAMMDSGGAYGRNWQRNQSKDLTKEPSVYLDYELPCSSKDVIPTVSLYHYLPEILELDEVCEAFNALPCKEWDSDVYGISNSQKNWLVSRGFEIGDSWNTYNGDSILSQVLHGTEIKRDGVGYGDYVLLQVHGGCDVRGGYTDAKLFKYQKFQEFISPVPYVSLEVVRGDETFTLDLSDGGYGFYNTDTNEPMELLEGDILTGSLLI